MLNILFDITHPAYVHLYKNIIKQLELQGHNVIITTQNSKDILELLNLYNFSYRILGKKSDVLAKKIFKQQLFNLKLYSIIIKNNIDLAIGGSATVAQGSYFTKAKSIIFTDDDGDVVPLFSKSTYPFANYVVHPSCIRDKLSPHKQILVNSYKELAYLHPNNFIPDKQILQQLHVDSGEKFFVVRFSALKAHHDVFAQGINDKLELIKYLEKFGRVFISSESDLTGELSKNQFNLTPENMHSLLYYSSLYVGDSQTMAAEAAVLGTPSIRSNSFVGKLSYLDELEKKYQLTIGIKPNKFKDIFLLIEKILSNANTKKIWNNRRDKMLNDKIDMANWFIKYINSKDLEK